MNRGLGAPREGTEPSLGLMRDVVRRSQVLGVLECPDEEITDLGLSQRTSEGF